MLRHCAMTGANARRYVRYFGLTEASRWEKPMEQPDTEDMAKMLLIWTCERRGKKGNIQIRTYDITKTKT